MTKHLVLPLNRLTKNLAADHDDVNTLRLNGSRYLKRYYWQPSRVTAAGSTPG